VPSRAQSGRRRLVTIYSKTNSEEEPDKTEEESKNAGAEIPAEPYRRGPDHPYRGGPYHDEGDGLGDEENP